MSQGNFHLGFWKDYSRDEIDSMILTVSASNGQLLIASFALYVAFVGAQSWEIVKFIFHQSKAKSGRRNVVDFQSQALVASAASEIPFVLKILHLSWAWRARWKFTFLLATVALAHFVGFYAIGLFSSRIAINQTSAPNKALLIAQSCGNIKYGALNLREKEAAWHRRFVRAGQDALKYAESCYDKNLGSTECKTFASQTIDFDLNYHPPCPFEPQTRCCSPQYSAECHKEENLAIQFDTGMIDMLKLGQNSPAEDRIFYRRLTTCTPVHFFPSEVTVIKGWDGSARYNIGPGLFRHYTFLYWAVWQDASAGYQVWPMSSYTNAPGSAGSKYKPHPDFQRSNADVSMVFISGRGVNYYTPVHDPVFRATKHYFNEDGNEKWYYPSHNVSAIGCIDQHQVCDNIGRCSALSGIGQLQTAIQELDLSRQQFAAAKRLAYILQDTEPTMGNTVYSLSGQMIQAQAKLLYNSQSEALPSDQWIRESRRWFAAALAKLQYAFVSWASKSAGLPEGYVLEDHTDKETNELCSRQVVQIVGEVQSFSVLGISILLFVGFLIVVLSLIVKPMTGFVQKKLGKGDQRQRQYDLDSVLQLQKIAFEQTDRGEWVKLGGSVPITRDKKVKFSHLCED